MSDWEVRNGKVFCDGMAVSAVNIVREITQLNAEANAVTKECVAVRKRQRELIEENTKLRKLEKSFQYILWYVRQLRPASDAASVEVLGDVTDEGTVEWRVTK